MRGTLAMMVVLFNPLTASAQAPVSQVLVDSLNVYLEAPDMERRWLDHMANEFRRAERFGLTQSRETADLVATLSASQDDGWWILEDTDRVHLKVRHLQSGEFVWEDSRTVEWKKRGAVLDLVKDFHEAVAFTAAGLATRHGQVEAAIGIVRR